MKLDKVPLYLRLDLTFGLIAGGSIGHIAGVVNNLKKYCKSPIFVSTDIVPAIDEDIENLEGQIAEIDEKIQLAASEYTKLEELMNQKGDLEGQLADKMERWVYLNDLAEQIKLQSRG